MRTSLRIALALVTLAPLSLAACGGGGGPTGYGDNTPPPTQPSPPPPGTGNMVTVRNNQFDPAATTVNVGTTVTWTWSSCTDDGYGNSNCVGHSVTFDGGGPTSGVRTSGTYSREFS